MKTSINLIEKTLLDFIAKNNPTYQQILNFDELPSAINLKALRSLLFKEVIDFKDNKYSIRPSCIESLASNNAHEAREILDYLEASRFNQNNENALKMSKVYLTQEDERALKSLYYQMKSLVDQCRQRRSDQRQSARPFVLVWGQEQWQNIIQTAIQY